MLKVKGHNQIIQNILQIKGVPYEAEPGELALETREFELRDFFNIIHYLDERFPIPQMINGDVENRARVRELSSALLHQPETCEELAKSANPFIFGPAITLVDLIVLQNTTHDPFKQFMRKVLGDVETEGW
jgi:glutathione S-transferase